MNISLFYDLLVPAVDGEGEMTTETEPADTRMMGIVHGALRRDLLRTRDALTSEPYPQGRQRRALGEHVVWMMEFLHAHHTSEDEGLWPLVRRRNPAAGALLDSLEAEHRRISPAAAALTSAGQRYAATTADEPRAELADALDALADVLFPHLDREVEEAMPMVSASITRGEWHAVEQKYNIKPKSLAQLGMEGHWLLDGIDAEGYQVVVHTVPAVPRFILLHGFARAYRRRAQVRWQSGSSVERAAAR
jgi:Hemerythrin HHE cation binding domain